MTHGMVDGVTHTATVFVHHSLVDTGAQDTMVVVTMVVVTTVVVTTVVVTTVVITATLTGIMIILGMAEVQIFRTMLFMATAIIKFQVQQLTDLFYPIKVVRLTRELKVIIRQDLQGLCLTTTKILILETLREYLI